MIKTLFLAAFVSLLLVTITSNAQLRKIPAEVTSSFTEKFPHASDVEWRDKLSGFTASFSLDSSSFIASFNNKGEWESTEEAIEEEQLPDGVQDGFEKSKYTEWTISEVSRIELPNDEIQYKLGIEKGDIKKRNLYFSSEGRLLKDKLTL